MKRRNLFKLLAIGSAAPTVSSILALPARANDDLLQRTPSDYEGPYYPVESRDSDTNNLLLDSAPAYEHPGEKLQFSGQVVNVYGEPYPLAVIDIWQTDPEGRYKHPRDRSPGTRREGFAYWGKATTDEQGKFQFTTFIPGEYPPRPAHIHYKVWQGSQELLTSQVYFQQLGGDKGRSRSSGSRKIKLQTIDLLQTQNQEYEAFLQIVI